MNNPKLKWCIVALGFFLLVYVILDYFNIPSVLGIAVSSINTDILSLVVNTSVVIALYIITYFVIDSRQIKKEENIIRTGKFLLSYTYRDFLHSVNFVEDEYHMQNCILPRIDASVPIGRDATVTKILTPSFERHEEILRFAEEGYITPEQLKTYLEIHDEFKPIILKCIIGGFDRLSAFPREEISTRINNQKDNFKRKLQKNIDALIL